MAPGSATVSLLDRVALGPTKIRALAGCQEMHQNGRAVEHEDTSGGCLSGLRSIAFGPRDQTGHPIFAAHRFIMSKVVPKGKPSALNMRSPWASVDIKRPMLHHTHSP